MSGSAQGAKILVSDCAPVGAMPTGPGQCDARQQEAFAETVARPSVVKICIAMWDIDHLMNSRVDISAKKATV